MCFVLRRKTYTAWLGSGWPEWVASDADPIQFNQDINRFQSIISFPFMFASLISGVWLDVCRRYWSKRSDTYGDMIGIGSSFVMCSATMMLSSLLQAQQLEATAYATVITHNFGRCFGLIWDSLYFYLFPVQPV